MIQSILWELTQRKKAIIWWTIGSVILTVGIICLFPSIREQANQLNQVINKLPPGLRELKSGGAKNLNVADPIQFLNSQLFYATLPILWIILAISRGSTALGRDEQDKTLELLLSRPISRSALLTAKAIALALEFAIVSGVTLLVIVVVTPRFNMHVGIWHLALTTAYTAAFSLSFGMVAFTLQAASSLTRRSASVVAIILGFGGYLLASLSGLTDWLRVPSKFAPYHYFEPERVLQGLPVHGLDIYLIAVLLFTVTVSYIGFRRRDIA